MTRRALPCLALAVAAILAACSVRARRPAPRPPTLDGHTYLSTAIEGAILVPGTQVRLTFADGNLNATAGCNTMGGTYSIDGEPARDHPAVHDRDGLRRRPPAPGRVARAVPGRGHVRRSEADTLTLTDGTIRLTLLDKEVATPDQPLEGTSWVLDGIVSGDAVSSVPAGVTAAIQIAAGRVEVNAGCNTGGGTVQVTADSASPGRSRSARSG